MRKDESCPTCGTKLGPLHVREMLRRCEACQQHSPRGFRYCGACAAPLETDAEQAERVDVAAPPGGWPSLSRELVEMRFFLERGELDDAYELLSILHQRHPGHPALVEFIREPAARRPRPDTHVHQVVDAVLADSSSLGSTSLPRRSVPQWNAPVARDGDDGKKTRSHATVPLGADDDGPTPRRARPKTIDPRRSAPARDRTDKHHGVVPVGKREAAAKRGKRGVSKPVAGADREGDGVPKKSARAGGHTEAVSTLQPPRPFAAPPKRSDKGTVRKRMLEPELAEAVKTIAPKKRTGKHAAAPAPAEPPAEPNDKRPRAASRFGQNVLGRLGGKGKP